MLLIQNIIYDIDRWFGSKIFDAIRHKLNYNDIGYYNVFSSEASNGAESIFFGGFEDENCFPRTTLLWNCSFMFSAADEELNSFQYQVATTSC